MLPVGIQTRSQRAAAQPVKLMEVRLPIKIVKLLVADLQHQLEDEELDDSEDQVICQLLCPYIIACVVNGSSNSTIVLAV